MKLIMNKTLHILATVAGIFIISATCFAAKEDNWTELFNGKDLNMWQETTGNWTIQSDGSLLIKPRPGETGWSRYSSYLYTKKKYGDFVIQIEYKYPEGGNSGLYFRIGDTKDASKSGMECQILDSSKKTGEMTHHDHGGIIKTQGASKNMSKPPGEWNKMVLTAKGNKIKVKLNGKQIIDTDISNSPMKDRPQMGYIGLQDHGEGNNISFRNIRIREL